MASLGRLLSRTSVGEQSLQITWVINDDTDQEKLACELRMLPAAFQPPGAMVFLNQCLEQR